MKLTVLGSGSSGNCYLLHNETECLVIDAGIAFKKVKEVLDFNISKIVGVCISHTHGDHYKYAKDYVNAGIPVIKPFEEYKSLSRLGGFDICPFTLTHDVPCFGFMIKHKDIGKLVYATDTSHVVYQFDHVNHIMIEANYTKQMLDKHAANRNHVLAGHMEIETTKKFIECNNNHELRTIVLLHLSETNSDEEMFKREISNIVTCPVWIADKGLEIDINKNPF